MMIVEFLCWVVVVGLLAAWILSLAGKWGWREWLQVHAPCDFLYRLFMCDFCCSWWLSVVISLTLLVVVGRRFMLAVPFCSTLIAAKWLK